MFICCICSRRLQSFLENADKVVKLWDISRGHKKSYNPVQIQQCFTLNHKIVITSWQQFLWLRFITFPLPLQFLHKAKEKLQECLGLRVTHVGPARVVLTDHGAQSFRQSVCHGLVCHHHSLSYCGLQYRRYTLGSLPSDLRQNLQLLLHSCGICCRGNKEARTSNDARYVFYFH